MIVKPQRLRVRLYDGRTGYVARRALNAPMSLIEWDERTYIEFSLLNNHQRLTWVDNKQIVSAEMTEEEWQRPNTNNRNA